MSAPALQHTFLSARRRLLAAGGFAAAAVALSVSVAPQAAAAPQAAVPAKAPATAPAEAPAKAPDKAPDKAADKAPATSGTNLDDWIDEALVVMEREGIPGSYDGIHRNILRESSGDPNAINDWDINAINGVPSQGLLQVIPPTFEAYHVEGTAKKITDPVANIVAACNYAADRYGTIDNVWGAY
ncbi:transglycosylase SLT domain-containing protein [Streptomyces sp. WMMC500]|uniref:transglycosylase SLT domain-containing protein n=1 Tax=Streptomyces sp. WMMC500 TaxID=3015154 RepID=UPI00248AF698|nr:transglycosylase SLT domain-containing protein [Streptomyces sp. WMMC500]WBB60508.1 transglycosylase SLT domain-containing protein [Streptomyces sp. WMMC500]